MDSQIHFLSIHSADSLVWRAVHLRSCSSPDLELLTTKTTLNDSSQAGGRTALANLKEWMFILRLWNFFFSHQNSSEWCKQRWWDLNQSLTYYTLTVMSSRYHLILNWGNIILVMYVISHPVLNCRVEWNLVKLCAHPLKYGWALSSFQVHFTFHSYEYWQMKSVSLLFVVIHLLAGVIGSVCYEVITSLHLL